VRRGAVALALGVPSTGPAPFTVDIRWFVWRINAF
jgi:hypothetical protein